MMMKIAIAIATEERSSDLHRLAYSAIRAANSHEDDRCFDILQYMKQSLNLSVKDLCDSNAIPPLASLRDHENPKLRMEANLLFNSWMKTLFYSTGRNSSTCNRPPFRRSREKEKPSEIKQIDRKSFSVQAKKRRRLVKLSDLRDNNNNNTTISSIPTKIHLKQHKPDASVQVLDKTDDQPLETREVQHKPVEEDCNKSIAASSLPMKFSETPGSKAHETGKTKHKPGVCKSVLPTSRTTLQMKKKKKKKKQAPLKDDSPALKKNSTEMLELFDIAKKTADVANAKGLLAAKAEASICVDTLSLLMDFSISSTATETRRIMLRLESLTKHKDRKICNSASALLHCWRQNIKDQQH